MPHLCSTDRNNVMLQKMKIVGGKKIFFLRVMHALTFFQTAFPGQGRVLPES